MEMKKGAMIIAFVFLVGVLTGCESGKKEEKGTQERTTTENESQPMQGSEDFQEKSEPVEVGEKSQSEGEKAIESVEEKQVAVTPPEKADSATNVREAAAGRANILVTYVGVKSCKACHIKQFKSWQKTNMASSFENLKPFIKADEKKRAGLEGDKDYTRDAGCLKCHTTGYGKAGGFRNIEDTPDMANVQCEACHGPGSEYRNIMKKNKQFKLSEAKAAGLVIPSDNEDGCLMCHGKDSPFHEKIDAKYKFVFKERLDKTHEHFPLKYEH